MSQPLRVLFVAGSLGGGGAERRLVDLLNNVDRARIEPRLYLAYRRGELLSEVPADVPITAFWDGETRRSPFQRLLAKIHCPCAARAAHLREVLGKNPVDVVMSWSLLCSYEVTLALIGTSTPHLAHVYCQPQADVDEVFPRWFPGRFWLARWAYRSAKRVVANSESLRESVADFYGLPAAQMGKLLNFRDLRRIEHLAAQPPAETPERTPRVVAIGRLHPDKGFDLLLHAMSQLRTQYPAIQLLLLGQGPQETELRELASRLNLEKNVRFLGFQANPYSYLSAADAFVLSSRREGMPGVLIEALACRVPVVAADCRTGPREILEDGRFGTLVPAEDAAALAAGLRQILASPPNAEFLTAARNSVCERFGVEAGARTLERFLEQTART